LLDNLRALVERADARVVLASDARRDRESYETVASQLSARGVRFSSFASKSFPANDASAEASSRRWRAVQILSWVQDHNDWIANGGFDVTEAVEAFVAIDADALVTRDGGAGLVGKFVMTHAREGLTVAAMEAALACLNATQVIPRTLVDPSVRAAAEREGGGGVGRGGGWTSDDEEEDDEEEDDGGAAVKDFDGDAGEEVVYGSRLHTPPVVAKWRGKSMTIAIPRSSGLASGVVSPVTPRGLRAALGLSPSPSPTSPSSPSSSSSPSSQSPSPSPSPSPSRRPGRASSPPSSSSSASSSSVCAMDEDDAPLSARGSRAAISPRVTGRRSGGVGAPPPPERRASKGPSRLSHAAAKHPHPHPHPHPASVAAVAVAAASELDFGSLWPIAARGRAAVVDAVVTVRGFGERGGAARHNMRYGEVLGGCESARVGGEYYGRPPPTRAGSRYGPL